MPHGAQARRVGFPAIILVALTVATLSCSRRDSRPAGVPEAPGASRRASAGLDQGAGGAPPMEKYVSKQASFVVYKPKGWSVREESQDGVRGLRVSDPGASLEAALYFGSNPTAGDITALAGVFASVLARQHPDLRIGNVMVSPDRRRVMYDGVFTSAEKGKREIRCWVASGAGEFVVSSIEAPAGRLAQERQLLLTILANVRVFKGALATGAAVPTRMPMASHTLSDGSASFLMPVGWSCRELGKGSFAVNDSGGAFGFLVGSADMITPRLGVTFPGAIVSPYLAPSGAWEFLTSHFGLASDMRFESVVPRSDLASQFATVYTSGPVQVEEFVYTCTTRGGRCRGYTIGLSLGSRLDTNWNFRHLSVYAPAERFNGFLPSFAAMLESYRISDAWARRYVAQGLARLRQLQQQTSAIVARNAEEIHSMMQAAYDERQRSHEYIDYQFTNYIRGEQDWISSVEGGTVYHSDSWGTRNTTTGESWEGQPFNSVNFEGANPKYNEQMQAINDRATFERFRK